MTEPDPMTGAEPLDRPDVLELIARLNEYERVCPIYVQALELIANSDSAGPWQRLADRALRDALRR